MTARRRHLSIAAALLAAAAVVAVALVVALRGGADASSAVAGAPVDPHAPVALSDEQRRAILNVVEATSASPGDAELVAQGRELFRSNTLAKDGESCQGCHTDGGSNADLGTTPHRATDPQPNIASDFDGLRDPPSLYGAKDTSPYFWIGDVATLEEVATRTILNHFKDGKAQPAAKTAQQAAALAAYMRTIEAPEGDFSQGTMSDSALRGEELFQAKGGCAGCHLGPDFTDNRLHDINVPQLPALPWNSAAAGDDPGAERPAASINGGHCPVNPLAFPDAVVANPKMCAFNTPTLRGVGRTAPYFHNGIEQTLEDVVNFYDAQSIIAPLNLTTQEKADLVAYLKAL